MIKRDKQESQEERLLHRLKAEDPHAFKELVELFKDRVLNTCYRFLYNREDAEDIAQETFIEIHRSLSLFREESKLSTWIYRIAVTKSIDFIRRTKRKKRMAKLKRLVGIEGEVKDISAPISYDPAKSMEQEERMQILMEAVDTLPENQRIAFTLSKIKSFGNKEIAEIMGTSLSAVESLMHRAKSNLKKKLYQYFERDLKKKSASFLFF